MHISYHTVESNLDTTRGYGSAGYGVFRSLEELGHTVKFDDPEAPVQISFCQPTWQRFHPGQYSIGYTPWESTELPHGWLEAFNQRDEVWATSDWVAQVYEDCGVKRPIHVYKHGLDPAWQPVKRQPGDVIKFLHMGEPALRKGGLMAVDAFRAAFGDREDVHLTVKGYFDHYLRVWHNGDMTVPELAYENVTVLTDMLYDHELRQLVADHDVLVYPSYGEGFGFIPLQALGTGMPVISTGIWAPYRDFLWPLELDGSWNRSTWAFHPGNVFYPNYDDLVASYRYAFENVEMLQNHFYSQAPDVHSAFNWKDLTEEAWEHIVKNFS